MKKGNKQNACLNGKWGKHVRKLGKQWTAGLRRCQAKLQIREQLNDH